MQTESEHCNLTLLSKLCFEQYCTHSVAAYWPRHQSAHSLYEHTRAMHRNHLVTCISQNGGLLTEISVANHIRALIMETSGASWFLRHAPYINGNIVGEVDTMHCCTRMRRTGIACPVFTDKLPTYSGWNCSTCRRSFAWIVSTKPLLNERTPYALTGS